MKLRSLRFKLSLSYALIISLVFLAIGVIRYQTVKYNSLRRFDRGLQRDVNRFSPHLEIGPDGPHWNPVGLSRSRNLSLELLKPFFVVTDAQGTVLSEERISRYIHEILSRQNLARIFSDKSDFASVRGPDETTFRFIRVPLESKSGPQGLILYLGRSMQSLDIFLEEYFIFWLTSVPVILISSVAVGWFLAGRALRPFEEVTRTAEQITSENLNTQMVTRYSEDEIQKLVQSFNSMVSRLDRSFRQMRRFNSDVAHELRTPLSILQGETEVALRSGALSEEIRSLLESNLEELERLTRMVNDLLTLAEAEAGDHVMIRKPLLLKPLLEDLVEQMSPLAEDQEVQIALQGFPDAQVEGDSLWIRRAFLNLLDNAIKYSRRTGNVVVGGQVEDHVVRIQFRDDGIGIAPGDLPYIFDRLYRADPARNRDTGGTGLGLPLVKWVVEAHQGRITVTSEPDHGSNFEVTLPLYSPSFS